MLFYRDIIIVQSNIKNNVANKPDKPQTCLDVILVLLTTLLVTIFRISRLQAGSNARPHNTVQMQRVVYTLMVYCR